MEYRTGFGLRKGITQCLMLPNHAMGFCPCPHSILHHPQHDEEIELRLQTLIQQSLITLSRLGDNMVIAPEMKFSKREKEILKWTAEGRHRPKSL
jgi:LuxR family transcriptional regulator